MALRPSDPHCPAAPPKLGAVQLQAATRRAAGPLAPASCAAVNAAALFAGSPLGAALWPIAEQQRREQQQADLAALVDSSDDAILRLLPDGTITSWNQGAAQLYGYTAFEAVGHTIQLIVPTDREPEMTDLLRRLAAGEHPHTLETERVDQQQQRLAVASTLSPITDGDGQVVAISAIECDISAPALAAAQLRTLAESLEQRVAERTSTLHLLYDVASAANNAETVEEAMRFALRRLVEHSGWCFAHVYAPREETPQQFRPNDLVHTDEPERFAPFRALLAEQPLEVGLGLPGRVLERGLPEWVIDMCQERRYRPAAFAQLPTIAASAAFPVLLGERVVAVLEFLADKPLQPDSAILEAMASIGMRLGRVVERKELERQIADATVREQRRIGRELHDSVAQQLTGISMMAETLRQQLEADHLVEPDRAALLVEHIKDAQIQVRRLSRGLMPVEVDAGGLMSALCELTESFRRMRNFDCVFQCNEPVALRDNATATHLYRIAQEALQNVQKHAQARKAVLSLEQQDGSVRLRVCDDGRGLTLHAAAEAGIGQRIMRYRAGVIGATLQIASQPGQGTTIECTLRQGANQENVS